MRPAVTRRDSSPSRPASPWYAAIHVLRPRAWGTLGLAAVLSGTGVIGVLAANAEELASAEVYHVPSESISFPEVQALGSADPSSTAERALVASPTVPRPDGDLRAYARSVLSSSVRPAVCTAVGGLCWPRAAAGGRRVRSQRRPQDGCVGGPWRGHPRTTGQAKFHAPETRQLRGPSHAVPGPDSSTVDKFVVA